MCKIIHIFSEIRSGFFLNTENPVTVVKEIVHESLGNHDKNSKTNEIQTPKEFGIGNNLENRTVKFLQRKERHFLTDASSISLV